METEKPFIGGGDPRPAGPAGGPGCALLFTGRSPEDAGHPLYKKDTGRRGSVI